MILVVRSRLVRNLSFNISRPNVHKMIKADTVGYNNSLDESQLDENILFPESDGSDNIPMKSMLTHRANKKSD